MRKSKVERNVPMYSLRQRALDDKISEQVSMQVLRQVHPTKIVQQCLEQHAQAEPAKARRMRHFVPISVSWFLLAMALWTRPAQARVWDKLAHKLQVLH